jgi:alkanesulfonate monooxygenase SsuD/methylene tetrahydromethanopterin reductase-like flavin-dependent oxidoreductase (luciferase family)
MDSIAMVAKIGGSEDLPDRVAAALLACEKDIGQPPTAKKYQIWREARPADQRDKYPSLTSIVPIAYPTWQDARDAAGLGVPLMRSKSNGPDPRWDAEACLQFVVEWLADDEAGTSLAGFADWVAKQRKAGRDVPSVSTIRLRLRLPWSVIKATAGERG